MGRYTLDSIIPLSRENRKPLLLWFSSHAIKKEVDFHAYLNKTKRIKKYLLDSMLVFRLWLDGKTRIESIKSSEMMALLPQDIEFHNEGSIGRWINRIYFDSLDYVMVVTDHKFNRMSPCIPTCNFYEDSIAFMNFLEKAKYKYDSLYYR